MTRPRPNRIGMYADLAPILDAALASGGGTYTLPSYGAAVHWRQRAYKFRKLYAETVAHVSKYDSLTLPRVVEGSCDVVIKLVEAKGTFAPAGEYTVPVTYDDDLRNAAEIFAKKLGGN